MTIDWSRYNFSAKEFTCSHCGKVHVEKSFLDKLQQLRKAYGKPMVVNSGYRCPQHPIEAKKAKPGSHSTGRAVDIRANGQESYEIVKLAFELGFTGIGVSMRSGVPSFVHLDDIEDAPRPNMWGY